MKVTLRPRRLNQDFMLDILQCTSVQFFLYYICDVTKFPKMYSKVKVVSLQHIIANFSKENVLEFLELLRLYQDYMVDKLCCFTVQMHFQCIRYIIGTFSRTKIKVILALIRLYKDISIDILQCFTVQFLSWYKQNVLGNPKKYIWVWGLRFNNTVGIFFKGKYI